LFQLQEDQDVRLKQIAQILNEVVSTSNQNRRSTSCQRLGCEALLSILELDSSRTISRSTLLNKENQKHSSDSKSKQKMNILNITDECCADRGVVLVVVPPVGILGHRRR
jgi:hypothetical protein